MNFDTTAWDSETEFRDAKVREEKKTPRKHHEAVYLFKQAITHCRIQQEMYPHITVMGLNDHRDPNYRRNDKNFFTLLMKTANSFQNGRIIGILSSEERAIVWSHTVADIIYEFITIHLHMSDVKSPVYFHTKDRTFFYPNNTGSEYIWKQWYHIDIRGKTYIPCEANLQDLIDMINRIRNIHGYT
jgi:hypothetical protein